MEDYAIMLGGRVPVGETPKQTEPEAKWLARLKRSRVGLTVAAIAVLLSGAAAFTDATDKLLVWTGVRPNALRLAEDDAKGQFSRNLTRAAWRRLFWMRRFVLAAQADFPEQEKNETWAAYLKALEEWNSDLMVNILTLEKYYGAEKGAEFESSIQRGFGKVHYCLEGLRHPEAKLNCDLSEISRVRHGFQGDRICS
jgi:hypothetical protein